MEAFFSEYPHLPQALEKIGQLGDNQYEILLGAIAGPQHFDRTPERCRELAAELNSGMTAGEVGNLLGSLLFIYNNVTQEGAGKGEALGSLQEFSEFTGLREIWGKDPSGPEYSRVAKLVTRNAGLDRQRQNHWLQTGVADLAVDFDAFVDLRPRFSAESKIEELIPIVLFRVSVESDHGPGKAYVFQLNMEGIEDLQAVLDNVQEQLESVISDKAIGVRIVSGVLSE